MSQLPITIEPTLHRTHGPCPDCGGVEQSVWGWVHRGEQTYAVYYVRWTVDRPAHDLIWLVCRGAWGPSADPAERKSVGLRCRRVDGAPQFMVIDATETPWGCEPEPVLGQLLPRDAVVGSSLARFVFEYVDQVLVQDPRVARFLARGEGVDGYGAQSWARRWWPFRRSAPQP